MIFPIGFKNFISSICDVDRVKQGSILFSTSNLVEPHNSTLEQALCNLETVANILGDGLVTSDGLHSPNGVVSSLDGMTDSPHYEVWNWLISQHTWENLQAYQKIQDGISQLSRYIQEFHQHLHPDDATFIENLARTYRDRIVSLDPQSPLLLPGGWTNRGGGGAHALLYEFVKVSDNAFDITLYTSTGCDLVTTDFSTTGEEPHLHATLHYRNVPTKAITHHFIQHLLEGKLFSVIDPECTLDSQDISRPFDPLAPYLKYPISYPTSPHEWVSPQRGGSCLPSVTKAWMKCCFGTDIEGYKKWIFDSHFRLLVTAYRASEPKFKQSGPEGAQYRHVFREVTRNLSRRIGKEHNLLPPQFQATVDHILLELDQADHDAQTPIDPEHDIASLDYAPQRLVRKTFGEHLQPSREIPKTTPRQIPLPLLPHVTTAAELHQAVEQIAQNHPLEDNSYEATMCRHTLIHHLVDQVPILTDQFCPEEEIKTFLEDLNRLKELYLPNLQLDPLPRRYATLFALFAITHRYGLIAERKLRPDCPLAKHKMFDNSDLLLSQIPSLIYYNHHEFLRILEARDYFATWNEEPHLLPSVFDWENGAVKIEKYTTQGSSNGPLWQSLVENDPQFSDHLDGIVAQKAQQKGSVYAWSPNYSPSVLSLTRRIAVLEMDPWICVHHDQLWYLGYVRILANSVIDALVFNTRQNNTCNTSVGTQYSTNTTITIARSGRPLSCALQPCLTTAAKEWYLPNIDWQDQNLILRSSIHHSNPSSEGSVLTHTQHDTPQDRALVRVGSKGGLTPYQLIEELHHQISRCADPSFQTLIMQLLFQRPDQDCSSGMRTFRLIAKDPQLYQQIVQVIRTGLEQFTPNHGESGLHGACFFYELSVLLARYLYAVKKEDEARFLKELMLKSSEMFLNHPDSAWSPRAAIHRYRFLMMSTFPVSQEGNLIERYQSFIIAALFPEDVSHQSPRRTWMIRHDVTLLSHHLNGVSPKELGTAIAQVLPITIGQEARWELHDNLLHTACGRYHVDLLSGDVYTPEGRMNAGRDMGSWHKNLDFRRLFSRKKSQPIWLGGMVRHMESTLPSFDYTPMGEGLYEFVDSHRGTFRMKRLDGQGSQWAILRHFPELGGRWLEYQPFKTLKPHYNTPSSYPDILLYDHAYWIPLDGLLIYGEIMGYGTTLDTFQFRFGTYRDGTIVEVGSRNGRPKPGRTVESLQGITSNPKQLTLFDTESHILLYNNSVGDQASIRFPRYASTNGTPLEFNRKYGAYVWNLNQTYQLSSHPTHNPLGEITNYLYLTPTDSKGHPKLLIPRQPLKPLTQKNQSPTINIHNLEYPEEADKASQEMWSLFRYVEVDIVKGKLSPTNPEAALYLAYLYLAQHRYEEAVACLRLLPTTLPMEKLSEGFSWILNFPLQEDNVNGKMVCLHAALIWKRLRDQRAQEPITQYMSGEEEHQILVRLICYGASYPQDLGDMAALLRMSEQDERTLLTFLTHTTSKELARLSQLKEETFADAFEQVTNRLSTLDNKSHRTTVRAPRTADKVRWQEPNWVAPDDTAWLFTGTLSRLIMRPPKGVSIPNNGKLLEHVLTCDPNDKEFLKYQLYQWYQVASSYESRPYLVLLLKILYFPDHFKELRFPKPTDGEDIKKTFLLTLSRLSSGIKAQELNSHFSNVEIDPIQRSRAPMPRKPSEPPPLPPIPMGDLQLPPLEERWEQLDTWQQWLEPLKHETTNHDFDLSLDQSSLKEDEVPYTRLLEKDFAMLRENYERGQQLNQTQQAHHITQPNCRLLVQQATEALEKTRNTRRAVRQRLLSTVRTRKDPLHNQQQRARVVGGIHPLITYDDCVRALLTYDLSAYQRLNPDLTESEALELAQHTLEVEDLSSHIRQLEEVIDHGNGILNIEDLTDGTRKHLVQQLAQHLKARYHFSDFPHEHQLIFRIFCGESGMIPRPEQMETLRSLLDPNPTHRDQVQQRVVQLIMSGGKTALIGLLITYIRARRPGKLSLFILPPSIATSVWNNYTEKMSQVFKVTPELLLTDMEQLSLYRQQAILRLLEEAALHHKPIVTTSTSLAALELTFIVQCRSLAHNLKRLRNLSQYNPSYKALLAATGGQRQEITTLAQLLRKLSLTATALMDEIELILDCLQETCYATGDDLPLDDSVNQLLLTIYQYLVSDTPVPTKNGQTVNQIVRLTTNEQALMSTETFRHHILPGLARHVAQSPILTYVIQGHEEGFVRYTTHQMLPLIQENIDQKQWVLTKDDLENRCRDAGYGELNDWGGYEQAQKDLDFLHWLDQQDEKAVGLIGVTRHLFNAVMTVTLQSSGQRHYGTKDGLKIIPFLGVGMFADTLFGYNLEEACYNYQYAAAHVPSIATIRKMGERFYQSAIFYRDRNKEQFEQTIEFEEFLRIFGVRLDLYQDDAVLEQARKNIHKNVQLRLELQYENIAQTVTTKAEICSSTGANLLDQLESEQGMGGTNKDIGGFGKGLAEGYLPDVGTEGRIIDILVQKQTPIHAVTLGELDTMLTPIITQHKTPQKIRGIIEEGGMFKHLGSNRSVAEALKTLLLRMQGHGLISPEIEYILFFDIDPEKKDNLPNTLYALPLKGKKGIKVGGTSRNILKSKGILPHNTFMYLDEPHTYGIDIPQTPDAINLQTAGENTILRSLLQANMRSRLLLVSEQKVELMATREVLGARVSISKMLIAYWRRHDNPATIQGILDPDGIFQHLGTGHNVARILRSFLLKGQTEGVVSSKIHHLLFLEQDAWYGMSLSTGQTSQVDDLSKLNPESVFLYGPHDPLHRHDKTLVSSGDMLTTYLQQGDLKGGMLRDYITSSQQQQSVSSGHNMPRYFTQQIDALFRREALNQLIEAASALEDTSHTGEHLIDVIDRYDPWFHRNNRQSYATLHKRLPSKKKTRSHLIQYSQQQLERFPKESSDSLEQLTNSLTALQRRIENSCDLPEWMEDHSSSLVGIKTQVQVLQKTQVQVQTEVEQELEQYEQAPSGPLNDEPSLSYDDVCNIIRGTAPLIGLQKQLQQFNYQHQGSAIPYHTIFTQPIYGTHQFFSTNKQLLPVFHPLQRPPHQIIVIKSLTDGAFRWVLLSRNQATSARKHIKLLYKEGHPSANNVWLIQHDGSLFCSPPTQFPAFDPEVQKALFEINVFGGNVWYLQRHANEWATYLQEKGPLKVRFLQLKTFRRLQEYEILMSHPQVQKLLPNTTVTTVHQGLRKRAMKENDYRGSITPIAPQYVNNIPLNQLSDLHVDFIRYLDQKDQIEQLAPYQIPYVSPNCVPYIRSNHVPFIKHATQAAALTSDQVPLLKESQHYLISYLRPEHYPLLDQEWQIKQIPPKEITQVKPEYWKWVSPDHIKHLKGKDAIQNIERYCPEQIPNIHGHELHHVSPQYADQITETQIREMDDPQVIANIPEHHPLWGRLSTEVVERADPHLVSHLTQKEQIEAIDPKHVQHTISSQWPHLTQHQRAELTEGQISQMETVEAVQALGNHPKLHALSDIGVTLLSDEQVCNLSENHPLWKRLPTPVVERADPHLVSHLTQKEQIEAIDPKHVQYTISSQWPHLTQHQRAELTEGQISQMETVEAVQALGNHPKLHVLSDIGVTLLSDEQIRGLPENHPLWERLPTAVVERADPHLVSHLTQKEQIETIDPKHVQYTTSSQWPHLKNTQRAGLTEAQISQMETIEQVQSLGKHPRLHALSDIGVTLLSDEQIRGLPENHSLWARLATDVVENVDKRLVVHLPREEQIQAIANDNIPYVSRHQWAVLTPRQRSYSSEQQIAAITAPREVALLLEAEEFERVCGKLASLPREAIQNLTDPLVKGMEQFPELHAHAAHLPPSKIPLLTQPGAIDHVTDDQIAGMDDPSLQNLAHDSPLWARVSGIVIDRLGSPFFIHLTTPEQIRSITSRNVEHLTRRQLRHRTWGQFISYTLQVWLLGLMTLPYRALSPLIPVRFRWEETHTRRLHRYITTYVYGT